MRRLALVVGFLLVLPQCQSSGKKAPGGGDSTASTDNPAHASNDDPSPPGDSSVNGDPAPADPADTDGGDSTPGDTDGGDPVVVDPCAVTEARVPTQLPDWQHVPTGEAVTYVENPPAAAPHWAMWGRWEVAADPLPRQVWLHNLEHGGIVFLYRPDAPPEVKDALMAAYQGLPDLERCAHKLALVSTDAELPTAWAVMAFNYKLIGNCAPDAAVLQDYALRHRDQGRVQACNQGFYPVAPPCYLSASGHYNQWTRVVADGEAITYNDNPPTSGPYYANQAPYIWHDSEVPAARWVGNLARGGVAILYRPDAPAEVIADLRQVYEDLPTVYPCEHKMVLATPSSQLPAEMPYAIVGWDEYMTGSCVEYWPVWASVREKTFGRAESTCDEGTWMP